MKQAFTAYMKYIRQLGHIEPRLPGLVNVTHEQLFFLSYAHVGGTLCDCNRQFWCGTKKNTAAVQQILSDDHAPERYRVIGVLQNSAEFARAYQCAPGSPMNPPKTNETKCHVW